MVLPSVFRELPATQRLAYFVDHPPFYDRPGGPYAAPDGQDWADNHRRFGLFSWAAAQLARGADPGWQPDVLHCHDWHSGLAPAYLAALPARHSMATVLRLNRQLDRGVAQAVVGYTDALVETLFNQNGVPVFVQEPLEREIAKRMEQLETELARVKEESGGRTPGSG